MNKLPNRPRSHILQDESTKFAKQILPTEWLVDDGMKDYGIDLVVEIVENQQVTGAHFLIQLKATDHLKIQNDRFVVHSCKTSTLTYFLERPELVIYLIYDDISKKGYWIWVQDYIRKDLPRNWRQKNNATIKIPKANSFTKDSIPHIRKRVLISHQQAKALATIQTLDNPYVRYSLSIDNGKTAISASPKYLGTELEHHLAIDLKLKFDATQEGKEALNSWQNTIKKGLPTELDSKFFEIEFPDFLNPEMFGDKNFKLDKVWIEPYHKNRQFIVRIEALDDKGNVAAQIPYLDFREVRSGTDEILYSNKDQAIPMKFFVLVRIPSKSLKLSFKWSVANSNAVQAKETLEFQKALSTWHSIQIVDINSGIVIVNTKILHGVVSKPSEKTIEFANDLAFIQQKMKTVIPWPMEITVDEQFLIKKVVDIITSGSTIEGDIFSFSLKKAKAQELANIYEKNEKWSFILESDMYKIKLFDKELDFGSGRFFLQQAMPTKETFSRFSLLESLSEEEDCQIELIVDEPGVIREFLNWPQKNLG